MKNLRYYRSCLMTVSVVVTALRDTNRPLLHSGATCPAYNEQWTMSLIQQLEAR